MGNRFVSRNTILAVALSKSNETREEDASSKLNTRAYTQGWKDKKR